MLLLLLLFDGILSGTRCQYYSILFGFSSRIVNFVESTFYEPTTTTISKHHAYSFRLYTILYYYEGDLYFIFFRRRRIASCHHDFVGNQFLILFFVINRLVLLFSKTHRQTSSDFAGLWFKCYISNSMSLNRGLHLIASRIFKFCL